MHINENQQYYSGYWPNWQYTISCSPLMPITRTLTIAGGTGCLNEPFLFDTVLSCNIFWGPP